MIDSPFALCAIRVFGFSFVDRGVVSIEVIINAFDQLSPGLFIGLIQGIQSLLLLSPIRLELGNTLVEFGFRLASSSGSLRFQGVNVRLCGVEPSSQSVFHTGTDGSARRFGGSQPLLNI